MSAKVSGRVWDLDLPHNQLLVLLALADHADHDGNNVFPSTGLVAWKTGYSEDQVRRVMTSLRKAGILVEVSRMPGKVVRYKINLDAGKIKPPRIAMQPLAKSNPLQNDTPNPLQDATSTPRIAMQPEPSENRHIEPSLPRKRVKLSNSDLEVSVEALIQAWAEACGYDGAAIGATYATANRKRAAREMLRWDKPVTCQEVRRYVTTIIGEGKAAPEFVFLADKITLWRGITIKDKPAQTRRQQLIEELRQETPLDLPLMRGQS